MVLLVADNPGSGVLWEDVLIYFILQDWSKRAVEDLIAQMSLPEGTSQRDTEVVSMATGGRMNLERSVDTTNNLPPRKAGCKNFYWKGFTSC